MGKKTINILVKVNDEKIHALTEVYEEFSYANNSFVIHKMSKTSEGIRYIATKGFGSEEFINKLKQEGFPVVVS